MGSTTPAVESPPVRRLSHMGLRKWKMFRGYYRAYSSESHKDTTQAAEHLASTSLVLLDNKPEEEKREIRVVSVDQTSDSIGVMCGIPISPCLFVLLVAAFAVVPFW